MQDEVPIACSLSGQELGNRRATPLAQFKSAVTGIEELDEGYAFQLPADTFSLTLATNLIVAEHECCPFLKFDLSVVPGGAPAILPVTGRAASKEFLRRMFIQDDLARKR